MGFSTGNLLLASFVEFNNGNNRFQNTSYAPLGLIVRSGFGTSPSYTSVSPTGAVDGVNNGLQVVQIWMQEFNQQRMI